MDCRKTLALALGFLGMSTCLGCASRPTVAQAPPRQQTAVADARKQIERPKKTAKAETWVAYGHFSLQSAESPQIPPAQRQALLDEARKSYQRAMEIDSKNTEAQLSLARLHIAHDDESKGLDILQKMRQKHPKEAAVWHELGMHHASKKNWNEALVCLHKAAELDPENREYVSKYGFALARTGRYDEGVTCLSRVMGKAEAHFNVARMLSHLEQPELSKEHLRLAVQINPNLAAAREMLAQLDAGESVIQINFENSTPRRE